MSSSHATNTKRVIYPAYCFRASPTYNVWVKLTAADLHSLRKERGFEGQNVYFYLNHPIRFVQLVGAVVAVDDTTQKFAIVTIDDGSGATLDVKINRLPTDLAGPVDSASNTEVDNVDITASLGTFTVSVNEQPIDIASVVKVKGIVSMFRDTRQIELKRISIVQTTSEEAWFWASLALFKREVLARPWSLSDDEKQAIESDIRTQSKRDQELKHEHQEKWKAYHAQIRVKEEKQERLRRKEEVMMNAGALPGTDLITLPAYMQR